MFPCVKTVLRRSCRGVDKSLARSGRKQTNVSVRMAWISFGVLPCREKKNLMTARVSMLLNCARPWRASELVSFLVGLRTYQHPGSIRLESVSTSQFGASPQEYFWFLGAFPKATKSFPMSTVRPSVHMEQLGLPLDEFAWNFILTLILLTWGDRGSTVVKVLCYKSEGRWFDPRWCHWNFSLT